MLSDHVLPPGEELLHGSRISDDPGIALLHFDFDFMVFVFICSHFSVFIYFDMPRAVSPFSDPTSKQSSTRNPLFSKTRSFLLLELLECCPLPLHHSQTTPPLKGEGSFWSEVQESFLE